MVAVSRSCTSHYSKILMKRGSMLGVQQRYRSCTEHLVMPPLEDKALSAVF
ncbi:hypothetical protein ACS0TY_026575 [Phlomoides rotata]